MSKFAIITGASTGIGFERATLAAKDGYDILVVADEPLINAAADDFKQFGTQVIAFPKPALCLAATVVDWHIPLHIQYENTLWI